MARLIDASIYLPSRQQFVSLSEARGLATDQDAKEDLDRLAVRGSFEPVKGASLRIASLDAARKAAEFTVATEAAVQDSWWGPPVSLDLEGVDLSRFARNPVVLFMHDMLWAVGTAERTWTEKGELVSRAVIDVGDEVGEWLWGKLERDIIRMASLSYRKLEWYDVAEGAQDEATKLAGPLRRVTRWELIEWSIVTIGADPNALGRSAGGADSARPAPWGGVGLAPQRSAFSLGAVRPTFRL